MARKKNLRIFQRFISSSIETVNIFLLSFFFYFFFSSFICFCFEKALKNELPLIGKRTIILSQNSQENPFNYDLKTQYELRMVDFLSLSFPLSDIRSNLLLDGCGTNNLSSEKQRNNNWSDSRSLWSC